MMRNLVCLFFFTLALSFSSMTFAQESAAGSAGSSASGSTSSLVNSSLETLKAAESLKAPSNDTLKSVESIKAPAMDSLKGVSDKFSSGDTSSRVIQFTSQKVVPYEVKPPKGFWEIEGGAGLSIRQPFFQNTTVINSDEVNGGTAPSTLVQEAQNNSPIFFLSLKKTFVFAKTGFYSFSIGPSLYYQQTNSNGAGYAPTRPSRPTFDYSFDTQQILSLLELQWTPFFFAHHVAPYVVLGGGANLATNTFGVTDLSPTTPQPTPANTQQIGFAADAGAGITILFTQSLGVDVRYIYLKNFNSNLTTIAVNSVSYQNDSHNILLSLVYRFGFS